MRQLRKDVKSILSDQCDSFRIEDGDNPQSLKVFVENDKVERVDGLFKLAFSSYVCIEVLPINDEPEVKSEKQTPLEAVAEMLDLPMQKTEDGEPVYLEEINLGRVVGAAKYSKRKPDNKSMLLDSIKSMLGDIDGISDIEVMHGKLPDELKDFMSTLVSKRGKPTPGCDCENCEKMREALKVPGDETIH